jgi:hypothetical protein
MVRTWPADVDQILAKARKYIGPSVVKISVIDRKTLINEITKKILLLNATEKYDPDVVMKLVKRIETDGTGITLRQKKEEVVSINLDDLKEGMILEENIHSIDGRFLLGRGTILNESSISAIHKLWKGNVIQGPISVIIRR